MIDLRSDTVTQPTPEMRRAMAIAEVGDDGSGEDPTVCRLEEQVAELLGKQSAVFVPSGTMGNQVALRVLARPATRVCLGERQHVVAFEDGAAGINGGWQLHTLDDSTGLPDAAAFATAVASAEHHQVATSVLALENTHMAAGGVAWVPAAADELVATARANSCGIHLDGARLMNAAVALGRPAAEWGALADTVTICLSKGLSAPVGSVVAGDEPVIAEARRHRKRLGGAMRQAGIVAAAGLWALDNLVERLASDHEHARALAELVLQRWSTALDLSRVQTNIVVFRHSNPVALHEHLRQHGILGGTIAPGVVRWVTHRHITEAHLEAVAWALVSAPD